METLVPFLSIGVANKDKLKSSRIKFTIMFTMNMENESHPKTFGGSLLEVDKLG